MHGCPTHKRCEVREKKQFCHLRHIRIQICGISPFVDRISVGSAVRVSMFPCSFCFVPFGASILWCWFSKGRCCMFPQPIISQVIINILAKPCRLQMKREFSE